MSELTREKSDLDSRVEEDQDEIEDLTGKQRALISQNTQLQTQLAESNQQVVELEEANASLENKVGEREGGREEGGGGGGGGQKSLGEREREERMKAGGDK